MQEADEQDTCRICSAPAEPDQPLFHPCKCSGTIRYIHQDCLTTWLAHSKKKNCDVCKHPYTFTKVYASNMPSSLPPLLLFRRLLQQIFFAILFVLRGVAVACIWLGVLPWVTVWTWRMYFSMGESAAWWISDRPRPPTVESNPFYNKIRYEAPVPPPKNIVARVSSHPVWLALSADIFTGQIIASLIVLTFVAVFLLREWISQNARPGVFEEEELPPPEDPPAAQPPRAGPEARRPLIQPLIQGEEGFPIRAELNPQQIEAIRALEAFRHRLDPEVAMDPDRWDALAAREEAKRRKLKKLQKARKLDAEEMALRAARKGTGKEDDPKQEREAMRRKVFHRQINLAKAQGARHRASSSPFLIEPPSPPLQLSSEQSTFGFTFKPRSNAPSPESDRGEPSGSNRADVSESSIAGPSTSPFRDDGSSSPFPPVTLQPSGSGIPFSLSNWQNSKSEEKQAVQASSLREQRPPTPSSPPPSFDSIIFEPSLSRPPLVTSTSPSSSSSAAQFNFSSSSKGKARMFPSEIPTFMSPEDMPDEAGPSTYRGSLDHSGPGLSWTGSDLDLDGYNLDEDSVDVDDTDDDGEEGLEAQPGFSNVQNINDRPFRHVQNNNEPSSESDIDMETERNRYFKAAEEAAKGPSDEEEDKGEGVPFTDSEDSEDDGDDHDHRGEEEGADDERAERDEDDEDDMFHDEEEEEEEEDHPLEVEDGNFFDDDEPVWEEEEEHDFGQPAQPLGGGGGAGVPPGVGAAAPGPGNGPGPANPAADAGAAGGPDLGEEGEANGDDDLDGAMEAIGMRGPLYGVFQNAALMIFVLDTAIGLGIWIPFTIGKTTALLTLDPRRLLQVLHLPIRAIRIITDPIVDLFAYLTIGLFLPACLRMFYRFLRIGIFFGRISVDLLCGRGTTSRIANFSTKIYNQSASLLSKPLAQISAWTTPSNATEVVKVSNSTTPTFLSSLPDYLGVTEPYFEKLGRDVRTVVTDAQESWIRLALGSGPVHRFFAIVLGYCVVGILILLYLNILTVGNARSAGVAVRNAVRQQLLVLKVASFIFIELVTFPLGCGIVLDLLTVWVFPEANFQSRVAFFSQAPLTAIFYHWIAGTMFMYFFAVLLSGCRSVMRPGAMWFIKDPQDQNSHPIRDILDRPTLTQLRKICVSGLMYSFVVACVVASVDVLVTLGSKTVMPFRWKTREPLSDVPVDLLFLHIVLPYSVHNFRPKRLVKNVTTFVWKHLATRLRLTSYFFGGRHPVEEYTPKDWRDNFRRGHVHVVQEGEVIDGSFRRVPATDNLALPRDMRATVEVTEDGQPVDEAARTLMRQQDFEAEKAKHIVKDDYMIVYLPPHFRYRIIAFIALFWTFGAGVAGVGVAFPIIFGRSFFKVFSQREVHDGYSFIAGFYAIWICLLISRAIDRLDKRRQRRGGDGPRAELPILVIKRGLLWLAKIVYMIFFLGIVIPVLLALVIDLYIILPIRFTLDPTMLPRVRVVDAWALGLLYAKIAMHTHRIQPPNRITRGLLHIRAHGWTRPDPITATREVIMPLAGGLLAMILFPGVLFRALQHCFPNMIKDNRFLFMHVYPTVFMLAGTMRSAVTLYGMMSSWSQAVRDKEFLVELRLRNHEPETSPEDSSLGMDASGSDGPGPEVFRVDEAANLEVNGNGDQDVF